MDTLTTLLEQADADRSRALANFNLVRARCDAARAQASQLEAYRSEYRQRWSRQFAQGATLEIMRCYRDFDARLDSAITQQGQAVRLAQAAQARASDGLSACELRLASVRKLIERRDLAHRQAGDRHERKADDEHATRIALARRGGRSGIAGVRA